MQDVLGGDYSCALPGVIEPGDLVILLVAYQ
jgi:hypothetical protein